MLMGSFCLMITMIRLRSCMLTAEALALSDSLNVFLQVDDTASFMDLGL